MRRIVLIVEDSPLESPSLEIALSALAGIDVAHSSSGRAALEFLRGPDGGHVCAVVTDLQMPGMDGFELIAELRADRVLAPLAIVVMSGDPDPSTPGRAIDLGADAFFAKPYSPIELKKRLEQLLHAKAK